MPTRVTTEIVENLGTFAGTGRVTTEFAESLQRFAGTGRVTTEIAEILVTFPSPVGVTMGQTFTGQLFLGSNATDSSIRSGAALPGSANAGDLFLLNTTGVLYVYEGGAWKATQTGPIDLTTDVTGILPVANGGTGVSTITASRALVSDGTGKVSTQALSDGQLLIGSGGAPVAASLTSGGGITATGSAGAIVLGSTAGGDLSGSVGLATVVGLQTTPVAVTAPLNGQVLKYNGAAWAPAADAAGIGGSIALNQVAYGSGANTIQGNASFTYDGTTLSTLNGNAVTAALTAQGNVEFLNTSGNQVVEFENDLFSFNVKTDASVPTGYVTVVEAGQVTITEYSDPTFTTLQAAVNLYGPELDFTIDNVLYTKATIKVVDTGAIARALDLSILDLQINGDSGTAGYALTSNGAGAAPTWQAIPAAGITALTGDVTATGPGSAAATLSTQGINTANNLGLTSLGGVAPTANQLRDVPAFRCNGAFAGAAFTLLAPTGAQDGRQVTFINTTGNALTINNIGSLSSRTMSASGGSTWVYSAADVNWYCTSNV